MNGSWGTYHLLGAPSSFCNQGIKEAEAQQRGTKTDPRAAGARPTLEASVHLQDKCVSQNEMLWSKKDP